MFVPPQEMAAFMQNQQLQQRLAALKDDPEFADMFAELKKGASHCLLVLQAIMGML